MDIISLHVAKCCHTRTGSSSIWHMLGVKVKEEEKEEFESAGTVIVLRLELS